MNIYFVMSTELVKYSYVYFFFPLTIIIVTNWRNIFVMTGIHNIIDNTVYSVHLGFSVYQFYHQS